MHAKDKTPKQSDYDKKKGKIVMKKLRVLLVTATLALLLCGICHAQNVKVKIAPFYTQIEDVSVNNRYVEYPLITYKDVTYFPMTYDLCSMLNLSVGFDSQRGLFITKHYHEMEYDYVPRLFGSVNVINEKEEYNAVVPTYPVYLNGIRIDNTKEEFPLINFRNVTYFPMTWRFAYEELNFDITFSQEDYAFFLERGDNLSNAYVYKADDKSAFLERQRAVYDEIPQEDGGIRYHLLYDYFDFYELNLETEMLAQLDSKQSSEKFEFDRNYGREEAKEIEVVAKENGLYLGDNLIMESNIENISDIQAFEFVTGENSSLISLVVYSGQIVPPYSYHNEYIVEKNGDKFTNLGWDNKNNFSGVFSDENGGFYVCSSGYSPSNMGRWSNSFSDVYYYENGSGKLESFAEKYSDIINSVEVIGKANGKLYVKSMWYAANKDRIGTISFPISAVNSGFYEIDLQNGQMSKIYPYIHGETFMTPNGALYCSADYARTQRLVNLVTGKIIPVE